MRWPKARAIGRRSSASAGPDGGSAGSPSRSISWSGRVGAVGRAGRGRAVALPPPIGAYVICLSWGRTSGSAIVGNNYDIILIGLVAVFLILRLRSVLGKRTGSERPPAPNPFERPAAPPVPPRAGWPAGRMAIRRPHWRRQRQRDHARCPVPTPPPPKDSAPTGPGAIPRHVFARRRLDASAVVAAIRDRRSR